MDISQVEKYLTIQENVKSQIALPNDVILELNTLSEQSGVTLDFCSTMELYKIIYIRVVKFCSMVNEFTNLSTNDQKMLLRHNLESVSIIRLAVNFHPQMVEYHEFSYQLETHFTIWQIFSIPWAVDTNHVKLYCKTVENLIKLPVFDGKSSVLFQLIALFSTLGLDVSQMEEVSKVNQLQEKMVDQFLDYLRFNVGPLKCNNAIHKYLEFLPVLRILSEKIENQTTKA